MDTQIAHLPSLDNFIKLSNHNINEFREKGHTLVHEVLTKDEIAAYRPVIVGAADRYNTEKRKLEERDTYGKAFLQIMNLWQVDEDVKTFVMAKRLAKIAADLMGVENVRIYHDQALFKEPGGGPTPLSAVLIFCLHKGPTLSAARVPLQEGTGCGGRQRRFPTGGAA